MVVVILYLLEVPLFADPALARVFPDIAELDMLLPQDPREDYLIGVKAHGVILQKVVSYLVDAIELKGNLAD